MYTPPQRLRPLGITIMAIIVAIQGILTLAVGLQFMGTFFIVLGVSALLLAWGLWTLQSWAYWTAVVLESADFISGLFALRQGATGVIPSLFFSALILIYLLRDESVRAAFRT
jgi:uncharacterized membrane protein (DUF2068 family)